jgi:N-methylhydantoinase B
MPASVAAALDAFRDWAAGDVVIVNDPFQGGTHLPDITMISPVFIAADHPEFFVANRAHHADVGGISPGSLPLSTEIYQEGLIIPPVKLYEAGRRNDALLRLLLRNVRTPDERRGDIEAQRAAQVVGERRLRELVTVHGMGEVVDYAAHLLEYAEQLTRSAISSWPDGSWRFEDVLEVVEGDRSAFVPIRAEARIVGDEVTFDFSGSAPEVAGSLNAVASITESACRYVVRCLVGDEAPGNAGCFAPVHVIAPEGTIVNARPPSAVAAGNVETSQRVVDVVLGALASALPDRIPAASQGTMNNLTIGGVRPDGTSYAYYETIAGGMGASPDADGLDGVHTHMTNTLNTPVEALELAFPFRVVRYGIRGGSGGSGAHRGGDGVVREYEMLAPATVTVIGERRRDAPWGLNGGGPGRPGRNVLIHPDGREEELPSKFTGRLASGMRLRIETPGGGGWGAAGDEAKDGGDAGE